ncbi:MAG: VanW family protein, partial [Oscillospiraceae bacterium]|nr:VanW family protein [Oscillospiraceae bacterium]
NVRKAVAAVNGVILLPGEEFDYNTTLGKRTPENGYLMAGAYSGGQTVQEYGGGICQISSMVYYCSLYANLEISSRTCHYFKVLYLPLGLDATVSWGGPEFRFVNNRDFPIKIEASVTDDNKKVEMKIIGSDIDGSYVKMGVGSWEVFDKEYEDVAIGLKAASTRYVYNADGTLRSSNWEATSYYHYHEEDIEWPSPSPSESPSPSPSASPSPSISPSPSASPSPSPSAEPTPTPTPSADPTPTPTPEATTEPTPTPPPAPEPPPEPSDPVG